jgi:hypothetical protein
VATVHLTRARRVPRAAASLLFVVTLIELTAARPGHAGPLKLAIEGVLGDRVALGPPGQSRTTVVIFMSRRAKDECARFGRELDERTLDRVLESVAVVDVHRYGGWLRRMALSRLRKSAEEALARRRERRTERGADASDEVVGRWHLVGDFDGALFSRFAVALDPEHPVAFVLDRGGLVRGPYRDVAAVLAAIDEAAHPEAIRDSRR